MDFWDYRGWPLIPQNEGLEEPVITTPHLMKHIYPDPKFILIFRNPVDRYVLNVLKANLCISLAGILFTSRAGHTDRHTDKLQ